MLNEKKSPIVINEWLQLKLSDVPNRLTSSGGISRQFLPFDDPVSRGRRPVSLLSLRRKRPSNNSLRSLLPGGFPAEMGRPGGGGGQKSTGLTSPHVRTALIREDSVKRNELGSQITLRRRAAHNEFYVLSAEPFETFGFPLRGRFPDPALTPKHSPPPPDEECANCRTG